MPRLKQDDISGRDHFAQIYQDDLEAEAKWQAYGAVGKADSIEQLMRETGIRATRILELGCGTGSVILECQRRKLAAELVAVDFSEEAIDYLKGISNNITCAVADITSPSFPDQKADIVILSHVLEHLEDPIGFIRTLMNKVQFEYIIAEVPLEDLPASKAKNLFRDRYQNAAGHVQFFTPQSFETLLETAGLETVRTRRYIPILSRESIEFVAAKDRMSRRRKLLKVMTGRYLPLALRPIWERYYYAHYAVLCRPAFSTARAQSSRLINIQS